MAQLYQYNLENQKASVWFFLLILQKQLWKSFQALIPLNYYKIPFLCWTYWVYVGHYVLPSYGHYT